MTDYIQFSAKTKSEAITKACIELGTSSDHLDIQVISEGSSGFFGIGSKPAVIMVRKLEETSDEVDIEKIVDSVKMESIKEEKKPVNKPASQKSASAAPKAPKPQKAAQKPGKSGEKPVRKEEHKKADAKEEPVKAEKELEEVKENPVKAVREKPQKASKPVEIITDPEEIKEIEGKAVTFLKDVFGSMDIGEVEITSKYNTSDGCLEVDFEGADMGIIIGKRGQTLDSLQYLTSLVVNKGKSNYIRVKLDTEDYRRRRKETLENLARGIAYKVKKTRKAVVLEPMNPYERRIIHSSLQGNKFVETVSEGEEPYRHVVVKLKKY